ncbi:MAG: penicillin-binding protein activator LpoB [Verrucomicrobia bacterium]|jgi:uncharacterized protein (TIGR02722 family)|nr:penicillin-binding protein activator LpoB [Verrucomicrobiota bacterium]
MKRSLLPSLAVLAVFLTAGCASKTTYVEPTSSRLMTTTSQINIQDFANAADTMVNSLIEAQINPGLLRSGVPGTPALLAISRIQNNTGSQIDTDLLVKKMRVALLKTGKVVTSTTISLADEPEDPLAARYQIGNRAPDYTLAGKIIEDRITEGNKRQSAFVFQLSLSSREGIAVWEDEKTIVKQGRRPSVGF